MLFLHIEKKINYKNLHIEKKHIIEITYAKKLHIEIINNYNF
jgi:hypothetical protein